MRLSEWHASASFRGGGGEGFASRAAATTLQGIFAEEDPMVFGWTNYGENDSDPIVVTLLAPFEAGLAKATVTHNPRSHVPPRVEATVLAWSGLATTLKLGVDGDPEAAPLPVTIRIAGVDFTSTRNDRADLLAFFQAAAALAR